MLENFEDLERETSVNGRPPEGEDMPQGGPLAVPDGPNPFRDIVESDKLDWEEEFGEGSANEYDSWMQLMWSGVVTRLSTLWDYLSDAFLPRETQQEYFRHGQGLAHFQLTSRYGNRETLLKNVKASLEELRKYAAELKEEESEGRRQAGMNIACPTCRVEPGELCVTKSGNPTMRHSARINAEPEVETEEEREAKRELRAEIVSVDASIKSLDKSRRDLRQKINRAKAAGVYWDTEPLLQELQKRHPQPSVVEANCPSIWQRLFAYAKLTAQGTGQLHREAMLARTLHNNPDVGVGTALERRRRRRRDED